MRRPGLNVQLIVINAILLVSIVAAFAVMLRAIHDVRGADRVTDDETRLVIAGELEQRVIERQANMRGYAIARQPEFLRLYERSRRAVPHLERQLLAAEAKSEGALHSAALRRLLAEIRSYAGYSSRVLAVARKDLPQARAIIAEGEGRRRMAAVQHAFTTYSAALAKEAAAARASAEDSAHRTIVFGVLSLVALALANGLIAILIALGVVRPIRHFAAAARKLSAGDLTVRIKEEGAGEVRLLGQAMNTMAMSLEASRNEQRHQEEVRRAEEQVSRALAEAGPGEDVIAPILAAIGENLGWAYGAFWVYEERDRLLRCVQAWGSEEANWEAVERFCLNATVDPMDPDKTTTPMREAWRSGKPQWKVLPPPPAISERRAAILARGIRAELILPVRTGEGTLGLVEFGALSTEPPSPETLEALRSITDLVGQVVERRRALEEAERLKSEFFALVSHELRTPLTSVIGYLDIVNEEDAGTVNDEQRRYLQVIRRNTERLLRLVGDLLFAAQVEAGTLSLERGPVDLAAIAEASIEAAQPRANQKGIELKAEIEPMPMVDGDRDRLGQLIDNLVSNALKFTPESGSVSVSVSRDEGDRAVIEVADTGMGIPAEDQEHLFERFYRAEAATRRAIPGIGLGLSICQAIAEGHGGRISVQSQEGYGATFRVELPLGQISFV